MTRVINKVFKIDGVATDATTAKLSDPTGTFGIKRNDTDAVVVADGTNMTKTATGTYEYTFDEVIGVTYTAYVEFVYSGQTYYIEIEFSASLTTGAVASNYTDLLQRVGHYLFGIRSGFSSDTIARPYVTSVVEQPSLQTEGFDPNDHIRVLKEAYRITWGGIS